MRTFLETIKQREIDKIAYECFVLMGERGVNPLKYVAWLQENVNQSDLLIESKNWISIEMEFVEAIDPAVQQNAQKAVSSLQDILKRAQRQGSSLGQISGIQNMLADLIYSLQNELEPPAPPPTPAPGSMDMDALAKSAAPAPVTSWNKPEGTVIKESITTLLDNLNEYGIDSKLFAEWYVTKGDNCKTKEEFNEAFGEFLGGLWNGVKSAVGHGWNQFTQDLGQPFNQGMNQYRNQKDVEMVKQAMQILGQLQGQVPHLAQKMQMANQMLGKHAEDHARYGSIQPQQGQPQQPQQPQQGQNDPWTAGLAKASSQARKAANPGGFDPQDMRKTMGMAEPTNKTNWYDWNASTGTILQEHELTDEEFFKSVLGNKKKSTWFN